MLKFERIESCDHCQGNGAEPGTKIKECTTCQGQGKVNKQQQTILGTINTTTACPDCQGVGKVNETNCKECKGQGIQQKLSQLKVKIPAGISNGNEIRIQNQGNAGINGGSTGDLYVKVYIKADDVFERKGDDIYTNERINITQAILGDKITIDTIEGEINLKVPEGTQSHTQIKLKNKGMSRLQGYGKGDHYVKIVVDIPKNLSKNQKASIEELDL